MLGKWSCFFRIRDVTVIGVGGYFTWEVCDVKGSVFPGAGEDVKFFFPVLLNGPELDFNILAMHGFCRVDSVLFIVGVIRASFGEFEAWYAVFFVCVFLDSDKGPL